MATEEIGINLCFLKRGVPRAPGWGILPSAGLWAAAYSLFIRLSNRNHEEREGPAKREAVQKWGLMLLGDETEC